MEDMLNSEDVGARKKPSSQLSRLWRPSLRSFCVSKFWYFRHIPRKQHLMSTTKLEIILRRICLMPWVRLVSTSVYLHCSILMYETSLASWQDDICWRIMMPNRPLVTFFLEWPVSMASPYGHSMSIEAKALHPSERNPRSIQ